MQTLEALGTYANATQLAECLGISRSGLLQLCKRGQFPRGFRLGHNRRWSVSEVKAWLERQAANDGGIQLV